MVSVRNDDEMVKSQLNDDEVGDVGLMMLCVGVVVIAAKEIMNTANKNVELNWTEVYRTVLIDCEILELLDEADAEQSFANVSDPDIEETFASMIVDIVNNPGQISEQINRKISGLEEALHQGSFDRIGGRGTLREIWARLKRLQMVSGVKRKLADRDWESYGPLGPVGEEGYGSSGW